MRAALRALPRLLEPVRKRGFLLMVDFDGVLAPIVPHHKDARMSTKTRRLLAACARRGKVAVISGRSLKDVRRRVALPTVWYAGNHGAEWHMGKARAAANPPTTERRALIAARTEFEQLAQRYPGIEVEDKKLTFGIHLRALPRRSVGAFKKGVARIARQFSRSLDTVEGIQFISVRPLHGHTKGNATQLARRLAPKGLVPIFIGDDTTDEDAFRVLKDGITVRVGRTPKSAARFFVDSRSDVDKILALLGTI